MERSRRELASKSSNEGGKARFQALRQFLCSGDMGQAVVQDGGSVDHGVSRSPSMFLI